MSSTTRPSPQATSTHGKTAGNLVILDLLKGVAILWIVLNHVIEATVDATAIGAPNRSWPSLREHIAQLQPWDFGVWTFLGNFLRYLGWAGDYGVALFLIVSGLGITWGLCHRYDAIDWTQFLRRRFLRLYPMWWMVHGFFIGMTFFVSWGLSPSRLETLISLSGLRLTRETFHYFSTAWWFFVVLVQLYLLYPLLWKGLRWMGALRFLMLSCAVGWSIKLVGFYAFPQFMVLWHPGGFALSRLPEFAFGMSLATWLFEHRDDAERKLKNAFPWAIALIPLIFISGITLLGSVPFTALMGASWFVVLWNGLQWVQGKARSVLRFIGRHSYSIYLVHYPFIANCLPQQDWRLYPISNGLMTLSVVGLSVFVAFGLEWLLQQMSQRWKRSRLSGAIDK